MVRHVTVFSLPDCSHCKQIKNVFDSKEIKYTEICLGGYPFKRNDMLSLCDRLTVPQVFFGGEHIGGAEETKQLLSHWESQANPSPLERYKYCPDMMGPIDRRLCAPTATPRAPSVAPPRTEKENAVRLPSGEMTSVFEVTKELMDAMPRSDKPYLARMYKDCFTGRHGVAALMAHYNLPDVSSAVEFGKSLQKHQILHHVCNDHDFGNNDYFFRLQPFHQPDVLNSFRIWTERVDQNSLAVLGRLKKMMGKIEAAALQENGLVDYVAAGQDPRFLEFEEAVCELQGVAMRELEEDARKAFSINIYNLMILHALIKLGVPSSASQRGRFYGGICYNIGGDTLSFDQVEHGIIRANTRAPYKLLSPFSKDDPRAQLSVGKLDPRIHFALNCGAKSCPPIKNFTLEAIDEELRVVAQAFCEEDDNVSMDEEKNELSLSMIFYWYRSDFAESTSKLPSVILGFLRGDRKDRLERMLDDAARNGKNVSVKFKPYDWNPVAFKTKFFNSGLIDPNEVTLRAFLRTGSGICGDSSAPIVSGSMSSSSSQASGERMDSSPLRNSIEGQ